MLEDIKHKNKLRTTANAVLHLRPAASESVTREIAGPPTLRQDTAPGLSINIKADIVSATLNEFDAGKACVAGYCFGA